MVLRLPSPGPLSHAPRALRIYQQPQGHLVSPLPLLGWAPQPKGRPSSRPSKPSPGGAEPQA